ncbi:MAG: hypothetical protein H6731_01580 [Myxococcales bacterium]|nr:MAG: hypothetical protein H6731_01580 [Myxococcales bacterium]
MTNKIMIFLTITMVFLTSVFSKGEIALKSSAAEQEIAVRNQLKNEANHISKISESAAIPMLIDAMGRMMNVLKKNNFIEMIAPDDKIGWAKAVCVGYIGDSSGECLQQQHPDSKGENNLWQAGLRGWTSTINQKIYWVGTAPNHLAWHEVMHKISAPNGETMVKRTVGDAFNEGIINFFTTEALKSTYFSTIQSPIPAVDKQTYPRQTWEVGGMCQSAFDACFKMFTNNGDYTAFAQAVYDASEVTSVTKNAFATAFKVRFKNLMENNPGANPNKTYQTVCNALSTCKRCYNDTDILNLNNYLGTTKGELLEGFGRGPSSCFE